MSNRILLSGLWHRLCARGELHVYVINFCSRLLRFRAFSRGCPREKLYFIPGSTGSYNSVANWYVPGPNNTFYARRRLPNSMDDAEITGTAMRREPALSY